jgi:hypothetical protein
MRERARALALVAMALVLTGVRVAAAQPAAQADALFEEGKRLRAAGRVSEACVKFAESQHVAPGVGVTLYLADCYERLGRTASAWSAFRLAERLAHERGDVRADVARSRASAIEPALSRLTIEAHALPSGSEVRLDGQPVRDESLNTALPVDPGDHVVTLDAPGRPQRAVPARVDDEHRAVTLQLDVAPAPQRPRTPDTTTEAAVPAPPSSDPAVPVPASSDPAAHHRWLSAGLAGVGAVSFGIGAAFLVAKNRSMTNDGPGGMPQQDAGAAAAAAVAFAASGAAFASAVAVYLTAPRSGVALVVTPASPRGGAGALLQMPF